MYLPRRHPLSSPRVVVLCMHLWLGRLFTSIENMVCTALLVGIISPFFSSMFRPLTFLSMNTGHRVAMRLLSIDDSFLSADVSKLLSFGEGIIGELVQETLEIFDSLEMNRTATSPLCGKGFSVRNGGFQFELRYRL